MLSNKSLRLVLICLLAISFSVCAQKKIALVVPYKPNEHFSDADQDISAGSEISASRVREIIRERLTSAIAQKLSGFDSTLYFGNQTAESSADLRKIYNSIGFRFVYSGSGKKKADADEKSRVSFKNLFRKKETNQVSYVDGDRVLTNDGTTKYYEAYVVNPNLIPYLREAYQFERIILLSMFELKTRADLCLDKAAGIYQRELALHYTILDEEGKSKGGDVVRILYPSNSNDLDEILNHTLPVISQHIALEVR